MANPVDSKQKIQSLFAPFALSFVLGLIIYFGGDASKTFGLAAMDSTRVVAGYALGIAEFLALAVLFRRVFQYVVLDGIVATALGTKTPRLLSQLASFFIYLLAITAIIGVVFEKDLTVVLASAGAAGLVIGMALKELILDVFAGLAINLDQAIKMGDCIKIHQAGGLSLEGKVAEISWRTTRIHDAANNVVIIPNSRLAALTITNFSQPLEFYETVVKLFLEMEVPSERALRVLQAAATEASTLLPQHPAPPAPYTNIRGISTEGIEYHVYISSEFSDRFRARNLLYECILRHLQATGLKPALAKREILSERPHDYDDFHFPALPHLASLLSATELFRDLNQEDLERLASAISIRRLPAGSRITQAGEVATTIFLVVEGIFTAETKSRKMGVNQPPTTETLKPGSLIGGNALLNNDTYESTVLSKSAALLCEINQQTLEALLANRPEIAHGLSRRVAEQLVKKQFSTEGGEQDHAKEDDLAAEVFSSLKRRFSGLHAN